VVLLLGVEGIAVGKSTRILPHNFNEVRQAQIDYQQFWQTVDGVTPEDVLVAMGTSAQMFISIAWARLEMLQTVATLVGKEDLINVAELLPPIPLQFDEDGRFILPE
jgi:hypothetical protein